MVKKKKKTNEEEIGSLQWKKFRIVIVKMIQKLKNKMEAQINRLEAQMKILEMFNKDLEELKNKQSSMENKTLKIH